MMQHALRTTVQLLKAHPFLLTPLAASSLLASALLLVQKSSTHYLLHRWLIGHSFFGLSVPLPDPGHEFVRTGMIVLLPFTFLMRVLMLTVYTAGFVATARRVQLCVSYPSAGTTAYFSRRILAFAAALAALFPLTAAALGTVLDQPVFRLLSEPFSADALASFVLLLTSGFTAWMLLPQAWALIATDRLTQQQRRQKWLAGMLTVCAVVALTPWSEELGRRAFLAVPDTPVFHAFVVRPLLSLLLDLPLGLLWIYLAVATNQEHATAEEPLGE